MREILFLAHRIPWPADRGDKIRSHHILKRLCEMAPVHIGTFADNERDLGFVGEMAAILASSHVALRRKPQWQAGVEALLTSQPVSVRSFGSASMQDWVDRLLASGRISHIFCFSGQMAQYVPSGFDGRFIMTSSMSIAPSLKAMQTKATRSCAGSTRVKGDYLNAFERECRVAGRCKHCSSVEAEADLFRTRTGASQRRRLWGMASIPEYYDPVGQVQKTASGAFPDPLIVFHRPDGLSAQYRSGDGISPLTRCPSSVRRHSEASFAIVGRNPTQGVSDLSMLPGVQVTGAVDDVRTWLAAADVVVAPIADRARYPEQGAGSDGDGAAGSRIARRSRRY